MVSKNQMVSIMIYIANRKELYDLEKIFKKDNQDKKQKKSYVVQIK